MSRTDHRYPALLVDWLTPVYDLFARFFIPEDRFKRDLIARAGIAPGSRVLDLGAGTGTLAIRIRRRQPDAQVVALDGDPSILRLARDKALRAGIGITFVAGSAAVLPFPAESFDSVLSTLVFSLLSTDVKRLALGEAYRVLRPGGQFHIADFGPPDTRWGRLIAPRMRRFEPITAHLDGLLPGLFHAAGFDGVAQSGRYPTLFGTILILSGRKPT